MTTEQFKAMYLKQIETYERQGNSEAAKFVRTHLNLLVAMETQVRQVASGERSFNRPKLA